MHAVRLHAHGASSELIHYEEAPIPSPGPGEIRIEVYACGVMPGDWKVRDGVFGDLTELMPWTMGFNPSGVVEAVGEGVTKFEPGDEVFGYLYNGGAFAEYAVGPVEQFALKPAVVSHEEAAGAPVSALAAWCALVETAGLQEGQTVLIQAGAGGVGHYAVQIADDIGATVYTTASPRNHDFLRELGADVVIDYRTERFEDVVDEADVVFDMIGGEVLARSYQVVKPGGYLVAITARPDEAELAEHGIRGSFLATPPDGEALAKIASLMEQGRLRTHISRSFPLSETVAAIDQVETGHTRGKVVVRVRERQTPAESPGS